MRTQKLYIPVLAILSLSLTACQGVAAVTQASQPSPTHFPDEPRSTATRLSTPPLKETQPMPGPIETQPPFEPGLDPLIALAIEDLAGRLGVQPDEIEVLEARAVMWPDSSLGCPQPGMAYVQVPEDGVLIRLASGDRTYAYRSGSARGLSLCETPFPAPATVPPRLDPEIEIPPPKDAGGIQ